MLFKSTFFKFAGKGGRKIAYHVLCQLKKRVRCTPAGLESLLEM